MRRAILASRGIPPAVTIDRKRKCLGSFSSAAEAALAYARARHQGPEKSKDLAQKFAERSGKKTGLKRKSPQKPRRNGGPPKAAEAKSSAEEPAVELSEAGSESSDDHHPIPISEPAEQDEASHIDKRARSSAVRTTMPRRQYSCDEVRLRLDGSGITESVNFTPPTGAKRCRVLILYS
ncbi:hypothetical protein EMIHUDRAFT_251980 [Emiliania huxleyi CCMP1516]|uniref:AP2/ERF domain-containing protein n=2 Tax=Emiliania huxleyi TaxID=2903 RepID=A0A0D3KPP8_EMIH1|nr:hypothetical protein EMIHUDRAFT_251980 [Emiliania huxleyi CCMP1516]EOD37733.1 hypothetical protein EMIHUDRAFT_251980 [Emiliania huxleyi CCMP1516]|eukprot:XP_005790162.1 hypothetical protein EMIHUDRAFT_251980 [Emiliania huxleyi CCMP1516]